ncbi:hypothetical protein MASR2M70_10390 [Bacillota bacterium]
MKISKQIREQIKELHDSEATYLIGEIIPKMVLNIEPIKLTKEDIVYDINDIDKLLSGRDFTLEAIAWNEEIGLIDPYNAMSHIKRQILKATKDPLKIFESNPLAIMRAIYLASTYNLSLDCSVELALEKYSYLLKAANMSQLSDLFFRILLADNASVGLNIIMKYNIMTYILGNNWQDKMNKIQRENLEILFHRIDETNNDIHIRLSLLFSCLHAEAAKKSIKILNFSAKKEELLTRALTEVDKLYFIGNKLEFKRHLNRIGMDTYFFYNNVAIEQNKLFDRADIKTEARGYMLDEIKLNSEPVFVDDLRINETDLLNNNLAFNDDEAKYLLGLLLDIAHVKPKLSRIELLAESKKLQKNPVKRFFRKFEWL